MANIIPKISIEKIQFTSKDESLKSQVLNFVQEWNEDGDFFLAKTSGSTGIPKEIELKKSIAMESVKMSTNYFNFGKNQTFGLALSPETIGGKMQILRALLLDAKLIVLDNLKNPLYHLEENLDFVTLVPYQLQHIIKNSPEKLNYCKKILLGGARINLRLEEELGNYSCTFYESYAMTESYSHLAIRNITKREKHFYALGNTTFKSNNSNLVVFCPELELKNLSTNDCVELISNKEFLLLGRSDFVINSAGIKFHPEIIEKKLEKKLAHNFFIIGETDAIFGEIITIYVENNYTNQLDTEIQTTCEEVLSKYEVPKKKYYISSFIKTASGKINHLQTQKLALES